MSDTITIVVGLLAVVLLWASQARMERYHYRS